ncbi:hypothetical protein F5Y19DRAFT_144461 [Xylariaceae sp. FL1651]|nr:hypothetical protein F5Y19DRAFT_144461 [Xylariaceae sp. FL1651]
MDEKSIPALNSETLVPASTLTPKPANGAVAGGAPPPPPSSETGEVRIKLLPPSAADDRPLVETLTKLVNVVYGDAEGNIYKPGFERTTPGDIAELMRAGQFAVAFLFPPASSSDAALPTGNGNGNGTSSDSESEQQQGGKPIGCIYVKQLSPTTGECGMLALDATYRGGGLGRDLVRFAEARCRRDLGLATMRLEVLVPVHFEHEGKARLQAWYARMGYVMTQLRDFGEAYPHLNKLLTGPTEYRVFEKRLDA